MNLVKTSLPTTTDVMNGFVSSAHVALKTNNTTANFEFSNTLNHV